jgi:superoxide dismutase, Fe-Mn family
MNMKEYKLEPLPFAYNALEPFIDEATMKLHHDKHHQTYCDKFNATLKQHPDLYNQTPEQLLTNLSKVPEDIRTAIRNHGGGFVNHNFFWSIMQQGENPQGEILNGIEQQWGSFDKFKEAFSNSALTVFGSGWTWLVLHKGQLEIINTSNQDSPLSQGKIPLLTIDVWEHAYYLKYQNKRVDYISVFFNVINWKKVNELYLHTKK